MNNKNIINKRLNDLEKEIKNTSNLDKDARNPVELDQPAVGRLSRMDAIQQQNINIATQQKRQLHINKIENARRKLRDGKYGICTQCGEPIAAKRLEIDPIAEKCVQCAEK